MAAHAFTFYRIHSPRSSADTQMQQTHPESYQRELFLNHHASSKVILARQVFPTKAIERALSSETASMCQAVNKGQGSSLQW